MPRLFTAVEIPQEIGATLASLRGGLPGARWIDAANYHVTLRFFGDVGGTTARDLDELLGEVRPRRPIKVEIDALGVFGGDRPRALFARVKPSPELSRLQAEHETVARRAGLAPESRKFTPHVTLARLRDVRPGDVAAFIARAGQLPAIALTADRAVLFSSRDSVGGGPYLQEAVYPFERDAGETGRDGPREVQGFEVPASWGA